MTESFLRRFAWPGAALTLILGGLIAGGCSQGQPRAARQLQPATTLRQGFHPTALDRYVARPDTNYSFHLVRSLPGPGETTFILEMTSQAWLTTNEVDRPLWKHWVVIVEPTNLTSSTSLLFIAGGANDGKIPKEPNRELAQIALATHSVVTELRMIPNQPLVFAGETEGRKEDSLIAYTWNKFLRTGDPKWPARLPMTKAAVRAMDTVTAFCGSAAGGHQRVDRFVVAGASKRGWTTWTTAAVDRRVVAIIPLVIDVLNVQRSMLHHYAAYGFWAPAIENYTAFGIMDWMNTRQFRALMRIVDPYSYRDRYTMPKFIINDGGDQFFVPDSSQFYFKDLPGVKYLRYVPNTDHSLKGSDAAETVLACYDAIVEGHPLPRFSWRTDPDGALRVTTEDRPSKVLLWQATNPEARDFRLETLGPRYESTPLPDSGGGVYVAKVLPKARGWTAFFVELTFPSGCQAPFKFTTDVHVVPDVLPHRFVPKHKPGSK